MKKTALIFSTALMSGMLALSSAALADGQTSSGSNQSALSELKSMAKDNQNTRQFDGGWGSGLDQSTSTVVNTSTSTVNTSTSTANGSTSGSGG